MNTKIQRKNIHLRPFWLALIGIGLAACGPVEEGATETPPEAADWGASLFLENVPAGALSVAEGRAQLSPGDAATIFGQIGGVEAPFFSGYAGFVLADTDLAFCNEIGDDHCPTPWDACCEDLDRLKAHRLSVQFVDAEGNPLQGDLQGASQLKGLDRVVVVGTVAGTSTPGNMIVNAKKLALLE